MKIELKENRIGYEVIGEYLERFWEHYGNYRDTVICQIGLSYDGIKYYYCKRNN